MDGVILTPLQQFETGRGDVLHAMKSKDSGFSGFGEAYFSLINKGCFKSWRRHSRMVANLIVPFGEIRFVLYNEETNEFQDILLSRNNYKRLTIEPGLWYSFYGMGDSNLLLNIASIEHDPEESEKKKLEEIPYEW